MVIFIIYLASNQSSHFQKISQMNVLNAINIGLTDHTTLADTPLARQCNHHSTSKHAFDTIGIPESF